jgi:hemolysin activation/secretion protein
VSFGRSGGKNTSGFELEELNILGTGAQFSVAHKTSIDRTSDLVSAGDQHAFGTWTSIFGEYSNNSDGYSRQLAIDHPFYALDVRHAGGVSLFNDEQIDSLYDRGQIVDQFRDHRKYASGYLGLSEGLRDGWVRRWRFGVTSDEHVFDPTPTWTGVTVIPEDRKFVYPWVELDLIEDDFLEYRNHDQIQRTEDFYVGTTASVRVGWADSSFGSSRSALMFQGTAGESLGNTDHNTVLFAQSFSGRVEDGTLRNGVLDANVRYYARQSSKWLFFSTLDATVGHNLDLDNQILLGGDNGLRGYPLRYQGGDARALFTVEQRYFTDWYPFRLFRVGGAVFFDAGRTWGHAPLAAPNLGLLKDAGFGLRFGNARSGLGNIIHVDVAFPFDGDNSIKRVQFLVQTKVSF